ncbi:hypothetical protein BJ912DRAFT_947457 [Pholiota molesta]|nr:hypothetical protein BJ912DRAFT_947457 [Pholiota molesta]
MRRFSECLDGSSHQAYACPSRNHQLDVSRTVNSDLAQSTRRPPPMKHRQSWRYGTDFGLSGRTGDRAFESGDDNECSSPESLQSTHLANYAASISEDGLSSLYECTASDFPKPPPMASPVIRRMRSSPWFMDETGDHNLQGLSDQQWKVRATLDETFNRALGDRARAAAASQNELSSNSSLGNVSGSWLEEPFRHRLPINSRSTPDRLDSAGRTRSQKSLPASVSENPRRLAFESPWSNMYQRPNTPLHQSKFTPSSVSKNSPAEEHPRPMGRLPRIIRKVASMRSEAAQKSELPAYQQIHGNVGRKSIPKARSFRSILQTAEADRARERANAGGEWHRPSSWVLGNSPQMVDGPAHSISYSKFSSDQDRNTSRHQHLSVPLPKTVTGATGRERRSSGSGGVLGAPFLHRPFGNHDSKKGHTRVQEQCEGQDSFMNITPDRAHRDSKIGGKRERMKDFLARASTGMFGWGKQRASRNSSSTRQ